MANQECLDCGRQIVWDGDKYQCLKCLHRWICESCLNKHVCAGQNNPDLPQPFTRIVWLYEKAVRENHFEAAGYLAEVLVILEYDGICPECHHSYEEHEYNFDMLLHTCKYMVNEFTMCNCHCNITKMAIGSIQSKYEAGQNNIEGMK